jgi:uncharacterized protein YggE
MKIHTLTALFALLTLAASTAGTLRADGDPRSISTLGVAEHRYPADRANLYLEIEALLPDPAEASTTVTNVHEKLVKALKKLDVPAKDVRLITRQTGRRTRWDGDKNQTVFLGYFCSEHVQVVLTDLQRLEAVTTAVASFSAIAVRGLAFESEREGAEKRAALLEAARAARDKAEALATAAGVRITGVLEIEETSAPFEFYNTAANSVSESKPGDGLTTLRVSVTVRARYAIE